MKIRTPRCPECPYTFIAPSRYRWFELPLALVWHRPYRCGCCKRRYIARYFPLDYVLRLFRRARIL